MKSLEDQDHYEVLEIPRGAGAEEVERAYRISQASYEEDSMALYSVFDEGDAGSIRARVERAYRVLSDPESRRSYDADLMELPPPPAAPPLPPVGVSPVFEPESLARKPEAGGELALPLSSFVEEEDGGEPDETGEFSGAQLRRARVGRGVPLDRIAQITKVSARNLELLEEDRFEELPAPVYVRGFVAAYARTIGLDPQRVAGSYMAQYEAATSTQRRGRLLGRR